MKENKQPIYVEKPTEPGALQKNETETYQQQYNLSEDELEQAFKAVGGDKMKLKEFLSLKGSQSTADSVEHTVPETAINPNPGANANIEAVIDKLSPEEIQQQSQIINHEVTDGEDG